MLKKYILCIISFSVINAYASEKLIFAIDLFRHGARTPITVQHAGHNVNGSGELIAKGMRQHYQLGVYFRKKYILQHHLLPTHFLSTTLYVRSTNYNRTLMSAESFLLGFYPLGTGPLLSGKPALPHAFQPIPIHTIAESSDKMLLQTKKYPDLFLLATVRYLQAATDKNSPLRCALFFAHDNTIIPILKALKTSPDNIPVPVASDLEITLYQTTQKQYIVHMNFNGKALDSVACPKGVCALKQFSQFVKRLNSKN